MILKMDRTVRHSWRWIFLEEDNKEEEYMEGTRNAFPAWRDWLANQF